MTTQRPTSARDYWSQRRADDKSRIGRGAPTDTGNVFIAPTNIERASRTVAVA